MIKMIIFGYLFFGLVYVFVHRKKLEQEIIGVLEEVNDTNYITKMYVELYPWINKVMFYSWLTCEWITWGYWFIWDIRIMYSIFRLKLCVFKLKLKKKLRKNVSKS